MWGLFYAYDGERVLVDIGIDFYFKMLHRPEGSGGPIAAKPLGRVTAHSPSAKPGCQPNGTWLSTAEDRLNLLFQQLA